VFYAAVAIGFGIAFAVHAGGGVRSPVALLDLFSFMFLVGALLIWTAIQLFRHRDEDPDVQDNAL
jgi:tellurite resistance protein TerC